MKAHDSVFSGMSSQTKKHYLERKFRVWLESTSKINIMSLAVCMKAAQFPDL